MSEITIGILAVQGAVSEHQAQLLQLGAKVKWVKKTEDLTACDGLILPGGESTAIGKLIRENGLLTAIREFANEGKPLFGTCAGLILLAKQIEGEAQSHLGLLDIEVKRNASGRQIASFETALTVKGIDQTVKAVFIRAPYITTYHPETVEVLATHQEHIVLVKQNNLLGCSFHPELTEDLSIMRLFLKMVAK